MSRVFTRDDWKDFIEEKYSGRVFEVDEDIFEYWLEVLPPIMMNQMTQLPNGDKVKCAFWSAEGYEPVTYWWRKDGRYFGCTDLDLMNPRA